MRGTLRVQRATHHEKNNCHSDYWIPPHTLRSPCSVANPKHYSTRIITGRCCTSVGCARPTPTLTARSVPHGTLPSAPPIPRPPSPSPPPPVPPSATAVAASAQRPRPRRHRRRRRHRRSLLRVPLISVRGLNRWISSDVSLREECIGALVMVEGIGRCGRALWCREDGL